MADPFEEDNEQGRIDRPGDCSNPRCEYGMVAVTAAYATTAVPDVEFPDPQNPAEAAVIERIRAEIAARRAATLNSWYPCRKCNRTMFFRWAGGHLATDHDRSACDDCRDAGVSSARTRRGRAA